jgi:hypothetical protein
MKGTENDADLPAQSYGVPLSDLITAWALDSP